MSGQGRLDQGLGSDQPTNAPACGAKGLTAASDGNSAIPQSLQSCNALMALGVKVKTVVLSWSARVKLLVPGREFLRKTAMLHFDLTYNFVTNDQEVVLGGKGANFLKFLLRKDLSNGVVRGVENKDLGPRSDLGLELLDVNLPFASAHVLGDISLGTNGAVHRNSSVHCDVGLGKKKYPDCEYPC